ncbi:P-loop nucleoside triphosphate hydrolase superfamily protein, putative [Medicago truncatula]|uniref:P-loop nucleoside triphosphate hydrolase superfamily protein, putative n=1 Tax=Medicago truncatula TaxID=3880 RepID=G7KF12_MEDTR|nr:P-loop nucleoside triphosphate hydrolase superfamily protein, putative [Medicago truncatula]
MDEDRLVVQINVPKSLCCCQKVMYQAICFFYCPTNHKDKVDSALLRPGRMNMHIHLSFLKAKAFRILASNYLDIEEHHRPLFEQIEKLLEKIEVTPAVVAEHLLRSEDPDVALGALIKFLQRN